jgi:hypothetical protein
VLQSHSASLLSQQLLHFDRLVQENDRLARDLSRVQDAAALEQAQLQVASRPMLRLFSCAAHADATCFDLPQAVVAAARTRESELLRQVMIHVFSLCRLQERYADVFSA